MGQTWPAPDPTAALLQLTRDGLLRVVIHEQAVDEHALLGYVAAVDHQPPVQPPNKSQRLPELLPPSSLFLAPRGLVVTYRVHVPNPSLVYRDILCSPERGLQPVLGDHRGSRHGERERGGGKAALHLKRSYSFRIKAAA